jgi:hypothetical protein
MEKVIFETMFEARNYRIRQIAPDCCVVEIESNISGVWFPVDDNRTCAHVYMLCCLDQQKIVDAFGKQYYLCIDSEKYHK